MLDFEVVILTIESGERVKAFADYYLRNGASRINIYFDGVAENSKLDERVLTISCDNEFWDKNFEERPLSVENRQRNIYRHCYQMCNSRWLLVVDIDEFLVGFDGVDKILQALPYSPEAIRVSTAEAIFLLDEKRDSDFTATHFRRPQGRILAQVLSRILYPKYNSFFIRGLLGHSIGKQFVKCGLNDIEIDIHSIRRNGVEVSPLELRKYNSDQGIFLCHFDAISYTHWKEKWDRRLARMDAVEMGLKRDRQMQLYLQHSRIGELAISRLFDSLYCVSNAKFSIMNRLGLAFKCTSVQNQRESGTLPLENKK